MSGLRVINPGLLSLLQDGGRIGHHALGLTTGGPIDRYAFDWANRLLGNKPGSTALEVSFGGLELEAELATCVAITGANNVVTVNGETRKLWQGLVLQPGDRLRLDFCDAGCRNYVAVAQGFDIDPVFGSSATVMRENLGGLDGGKLRSGQLLPCGETTWNQMLRLPESLHPEYPDHLVARVVPGYQYEHFSTVKKRLFFGSEYVVSEASDRMGYRLDGPAVASPIQAMLSEGICLGAIQIPADGQPIVLLQDRQTIGGYPKLGAVLSLDCYRLAQLRPGGRVEFAPISMAEAHNELHLAAVRFNQVELDQVPA